MAEYQPTVFEGKVQGREIIGGDSDGMSITGPWMNKRNGQIINVRQAIQDGENMIIITDNGQLSMDIFSRDYIQASDEIFDDSGKIIGSEPMQIDHDLDAILNYENNYMTSNAQISKFNSPIVESNTNDKIIKKLFDKLSTYPHIDINIEWDEFPEAQINTLVDYLEINLEDISKYIIKNYINIDCLSSLVTDLLLSKRKKIHNEHNKNMVTIKNE